MTAPGFGATLKRHRVAAGMTQEDLAERAAISVRAISDLERGLYQRPYRSTVERLAGALGLTGEARERFLAAGGRAPTRPAVAQIGSTSPLVGRAAEVALLEGFLQTPRRPVLLFAGEAGIGKSRLLHEAGRLGAELGMTVLRGSCERRSAQEPYAPLLQALSGHIAGLPEERVRAALGRSPWLVRLFPELSALVRTTLPPSTLPPEAESRLVTNAVLAFLAETAGRPGALLLLDDLQWAGADAFHLLGALARAQPPRRIAVVGAYRDTEEGEALRTALSDLAHRELVIHHVVPPLQREDGAALLRAVMGSEGDGEKRMGAILDRAGGVPFFLVSYADDLAGRDDAALAEIPWSIGQSVRQRVAALPEGGKRAIEIAALVGRIASLDILLAVSPGEEEEVLLGLDAACGARLLAGLQQREYRFTHDVIREVVEADMGAGRRAVLHRHIAEAMAAQPAGSRRADVIAWHFAEGSDPARALPFAVEAGDRAQSMLAQAEAHRDFSMALELARTLADDASTARILQKLAAVNAATGSFNDALVALEEAHTLYRVLNDGAALAGLAAQIGRVHADRGDLTQGVHRIEEAIEQMGDQPAAGAVAPLWSALAQLHYRDGNYARAEPAAATASSLAAQAGLSSLHIDAEITRGTAIADLGRIDEGLEIVDAAALLAERAGDRENLARALNNNAATLMERGDLTRAISIYERVLGIAREVGNPLHIALALVNFGNTLVLLGRWEEAAACLTDAVERTRKIGPSWYLSVPFGSLGALRLAQGRTDEGLRLIGEAYEVESAVSRHGALALAEYHLLEGRTQKVLDLLLPDLEDSGTEDVHTIYFLPYVAWAYLLTGDEAEADRLASRGVKLADDARFAPAQADALRVQSMVLRERGDLDGSLHAVSRGLDHAISVPLPYAAARLLFERGQTAMRRGESTAARESLKEALDRFRTLGAGLYIGRTEALIAEVTSSDFS